MTRPPVTKKDWANLRKDARQAFPEKLLNQPLDEVLLPYQQEVLQAVDDNDVVGIEKSRRTGFTWGIGAVAVLHAAASHAAGGMDAMYIGYSLDMTREFIDVAAMWAKAFNEVSSEVEEFIFKDKDGEKDIQAFRITFTSGYEIMALSSRPRSLRGKQGLVIIDEAAFHDDFPGLMKAALALLMWGGKVVFLSTHFGDDNHFNEILKEAREGKKPYKVIKITFDRALEEGLFKRICLVRGTEWSPEAEAEWREKIVSFYGDDADEELFCIPSRSGGVYLSSSLIESCMQGGIPVIKWTPPAKDFVDWDLEKAKSYVDDWCTQELKEFVDLLPADCRHYFGSDFARSGDLTVFWVGTEQIDLTLRTPLVLELRDAPFRTQEQILSYVIDRLPSFSGAALDARGNGQALAEYARQKYGPDMALEVMISEKWYHENMPHLKTRLEDRTIILPKNSDVLTDLRLIKLIKGVPRIPDTHTKDKAGNKRHGDAAVALCMMLHAREELGSVEPWEVETAIKPYSNSLLAGF